MLKPVFALCLAAILLFAGCVSQQPISQGTDAQGNHWRGAEKPLLTIYEYSDFECPACKAAEPQVESFISRYQAKGIKLVYRHFPLEEIHPQSRLAAIASECAGKEGKFWEYHDILFKNSPALSRDDLVAYAKEAGLSDFFPTCLDSEAASAPVDAGLSAGLSLGLRGTPSFEIGGITLTGTDNLEQKLSQATERALSGRGG